MTPVPDIVDRVKRLEIAVERLCNIIRNLPYQGGFLNVELDLIKQYVRGDLEPRHDPH
jgi:hypothetical protein